MRRMFSQDHPEPRRINGLTVIGPDLFGTDDDGRPLSPIATVFPSSRVLICGRGIHAMQVAPMLEYLREKVYREEGRDLTIQDEDAVYRDTGHVVAGCSQADVLH